MAREFTFQVNGTSRSVPGEAATPLLYVLRNDLQLRGTRHGCGEGHCGACTVLLDDRPVTACNTSLEAVDGRRVETIEALAGEHPRHPLLDAVIQEQAGQCGYCLPGILLRAKALLSHTRKPGRAEIAEALDGNLCRCGAHNRILRAIERAATALPAEAPE